jgi:phosphatidylglycerol lysyltransferase
MIQLALSALSGVAIVGVLSPAAPDTAAAEGIGTIEAPGSAHPLALVLPLLLPIALTTVLVISRRLFPVGPQRGRTAS